MSSTVANRLKEILGLETEPLAVFLLPAGTASTAFDGFAEVTGHRYCQLLMRARHGESLRLAPDGLACPAAASAFGFKPLPAGLATGKGLVGFGIVAEPPTGKAMFEGMTRLPPDSLGASPSARSTRHRCHPMSSWWRDRPSLSCGLRSRTSIWLVGGDGGATRPCFRPPAWMRPSSLTSSSG